MNISDLGSIGEFVSSIAVVVSLLYLAYQVRQNTSQMYRAELNSTFEHANALRQALLDESLARLIVKAQSDPEGLSAEDHVRLDSILSMAMWQNYNIWDRVKVGVMEEGHWLRIKATAAPAFGNEIGLAWWKVNRVAFDPEFVLEIDQLLGSEGI